VKVLLESVRWLQIVLDGVKSVFLLLLLSSLDEADCIDRLLLQITSVVLGDNDHSVVALKIAEWLKEIVFTKPKLQPLVVGSKNDDLDRRLVQERSKQDPKNYKIFSV